MVCVYVVLGLIVQFAISGESVEGVHVLIATGAAAYAVAAYSDRRSSFVGLAVLGSGFGLWLSQDANVRSGQASERWAAAFFVLYLLAAWLLGTVVQARRGSAAAAARAAAAEREAERAVHEERNRIARELHDIVSHNLSVVVVQAAGARALGGRPERDTDSTLEKIESSGRSALGEMRRLLNVLRADDDQASPTPGLAPIPGIDQLSVLIESVTDAGVHVNLMADVRSADVPPAVDVSVYRIVQEALTNTLRHGGARPSAQVVVSRDDSSVLVTVIDDGPGTGGDAQPGHGLRGMRERIALLGGELTAGPRPQGGFAVTARLPFSEGA